MLYTTQDKIEKVLQRSLTANETEVVQDVIRAVGASINAYTGRSWNDIHGTNPEPETRHYDGSGQRDLFVDDYISISELKLLDTFGNTIETIAQKDYVTYPLNSDWKNSIYLRWRRFPYTRSGVSVTGVFTTGSVPSEVVLAASTLAGLIYSSSRNVGDFKKESIEGYSYEILTGNEVTSQEQSVLDKLDLWRKIEI